MKMHCAVISTAPVPLYVEQIRQKLLKKEITTTIYGWDALDNNELFHPVINPLIIIADACNCPAYMPNMIHHYLSVGGKVVVLGGPPFKNEFYSLNNHEVDEDELARRFSNGEFDKTVLIPFDSAADLAGFQKDTYNPDSKKHEGSAYLSLADDSVTNGKCLRYYTDRFSINESFETEIRIKQGHNVLGFWAKGYENTRTITIQLIEENGNLFKTRITPSSQFAYFMLSKKDFVYAGNRSGISYARDKRPSSVNFHAVCKIQFGHALSHAYSVAGEHCFFLDELASGHISVYNDQAFTMDGLYPDYRFYPVTNAVSVKGYEGQAILSPVDYHLPAELFSLSPRAQATGIDKARRFRFIPLIEAYDENQLRCGYLAYLLLNFSYGDKKSNEDGSFLAVFTTSDDAFYLNGGDTAVAETVCAMLSPVLLLEGGANEYIYRDDCDTATYGAVLLAREDADLSGYKVKVQLENVSNIYGMDELTTIKTQEGYRFQCVTFTQPPAAGSVTVSLVKDEQICDFLTHEVKIHTLKPPEMRKFARIEKGTNEIYIGDEPARFFGVNYMPSANTGMETHDEFEHYVAVFAYDPTIIETDLKRAVAIGINAVSIFLHYEPSIHSNNILHLVSLCEDYGIYVNLSLRPKADPFDFDETQVREMIERYRFAENDTIVGYDIAWERYVGTYEPCYGNFNGRKSFDESWRFFLLNRYGSFENAEQFFLSPLPRNAEGDIIGLSDDMLRMDGAHTALAAAYRCCIDGEVARAHSKACAFIHSVDPNHLITARSGDASTIPLVDPGIYGYDYKATALALDFMAPESYALSDDNKSMRQGVFTNLYSRYANPDTVVQWMEFGKSIWIGSNFADNTKSLEFQATYYQRFFDMLLLGHTAGLFAWWWAGGYRVGENSDFGIVAPDGSDRPVTKVFREYAKKFLNAPPLRAASYRISVDRDCHADGLLSLYRSIETELFDALSRGEMVELTDGGCNKNSADVELTEVGNLAPHGYSPKYLNSLVIGLIAILDDGSKIELTNGGKLEIGKSKAVTLAFRMMNPQRTVWLSGDDYGSVSLKTCATSDYEFALPLYADVAGRESAEFSITLNCERKGMLLCVLHAKERTDFGERISIEFN